MIDPQKYIKFNEGEIVISKTEYDKLKECGMYIEHFKQPTISESLSKFVIWCTGSEDFDKLFMDKEFREKWHLMKERMNELLSKEILK